MLPRARYDHVMIALGAAGSRARAEEDAMTVPQQSWQPDRQGPLHGVRVLDFSRLVAGNMLSLQLADFGAEVVKVETPGRGDTLRDWRERGVRVHWKV